jgi:hypothetical protein
LFSNIHFHLGKFQKEHDVIQGIFMAAKCYWIETSKEKEILVHKGGTKKEWKELVILLEGKANLT